MKGLMGMELPGLLPPGCCCPETGYEGLQCRRHLISQVVVHSQRGPSPLPVAFLCWCAMRVTTKGFLSFGLSARSELRSLASVSPFSTLAPLVSCRPPVERLQLPPAFACSPFLGQGTLQRGLQDPAPIPAVLLRTLRLGQLLRPF